jgi:hypothetical protein
LFSVAERERLLDCWSRWVSAYKQITYESLIVSVVEPELVKKSEPEPEP